MKLQYIQTTMLHTFVVNCVETTTIYWILCFIQYLYYSQKCHFRHCLIMRSWMAFSFYSCLLALSIFLYSSPKCHATNMLQFRCMLTMHECQPFGTASISIMLGETEHRNRKFYFERCDFYTNICRFVTLLSELFVLVSGFLEHLHRNALNTTGLCHTRIK